MFRSRARTHPLRSETSEERDFEERRNENHPGPQARLRQLPESSGERGTCRAAGLNPIESIHIKYILQLNRKHLHTICCGHRIFAYIRREATKFSSIFAAKRRNFCRYPVPRNAPFLASCAPIPDPQEVWTTKHLSRCERPYQFVRNFLLTD